MKVNKISNLTINNSKNRFEKIKSEEPPKPEVVAKKKLKNTSRLDITI